MFNKESVYSFFDYLKTTINPANEFNPFYLPSYLFDPSLNYENSLSRFLNTYQTQLELSKKNWIGIVWKRSSLKPDPRNLSYRTVDTIRKDISDPLNPVGDIYRFKRGSINLSVNFFSNNIDLIEELEERFFIFITQDGSFETTYQYLNDPETFTVNYYDFDYDEPDVLVRADTGDLCVLETTLELCYPVEILKQADKSLIRADRIHVNITVKDKVDK